MATMTASSRFDIALEKAMKAERAWSRAKQQNDTVAASSARAEFRNARREARTILAECAR